MDYKLFLDQLDEKLEKYRELHKDFICCKIGCSACCEKGDYPLSAIELEYLMQGYINLDTEKKKLVQENIKNMKKGESCPFLINNKCAVYPYRPIICRVHGLAYLCGGRGKCRGRGKYENKYGDKADKFERKVKVPHCTIEGKNYSKVYDGKEIFINPIKENLDTPNLLKDFDYGEIRNLYDWIKK